MNKYRNRRQEPEGPPVFELVILGVSCVLVIYGMVLIDAYREKPAAQPSPIHNR